MNRILSVALVGAFLLAGCAGSSDSTETSTRPVLATNKGGIQGLFIDDVYRPIVGGKILLQPDGLTSVTDNVGQFQFVDLDPGTYTLRADADGYEAAPITVDVRAGEFSEVELGARRIFSEGSRIITTQYSVFIPWPLTTWPTAMFWIARWTSPATRSGPRSARITPRTAAT